MNKHLACLAMAILLCCIADTIAQNDASQTKPKVAEESKEFKIKTELLEVRAVVMDRKGQIIENLKKEDFELLEDDQPQEISFFSVSQVESERSKTAAAPGEAQDKSAPVQSTQER